MQTSSDQKIIHLLQSYANTEYAKNIISPKIAKKALLMNHLYEDLGLQSRDMMNKLMQIHFPTLAKQKPPYIRWKKFLFDNIGEIAPACKYCHDQTNCFGCELHINLGATLE